MPPRNTAGIRAVISRVRSGKVQRADFTGRARETFIDREYFQHYGFASRPLKDSEGIALFLGADVNNAVIIATEDRRYRISLMDGEVAIYDDQGNKVHLKRNNTIEVKAATKVIVDTPLCEFTGDVDVSGDVHADGDISASGALTDVTGNTNHHSHP